MSLRPLLIAFLLLLPMQQASAAGLSPYVKRVLERSEKARGEIDSWLSQETANADWGVENERACLDSSNSAVFGSRTYEQLRGDEEPRLREQTACLYADRILLLQEMERVRSLIKKACEDHKPRIIGEASSLYLFLHERLRVLEWGALNIYYEDPGWSSTYSFDPEDDRDALKEEKVCPFSTKYFDVSLHQDRGCTPEVMDAVLGDLDIGDEWGNVKQTIESERDSLKKFREELSNSSSSSIPRQRQMEGCQKEWPDPLETWSPGRFSARPGERFLWLLNLLWHIEILRPSPYLPYEALGINFGDGMLNQPLSIETLRFSGEQMQADTPLRGGALEAQDLEDAFMPLTETIATFSKLASQRGQTMRSIRDMVFDFAYYLRRSCMNRTCNASLERVMRIVQSDKCFPYTSGDGDPEEGETQEEKEDRIRKLEKACKDEAKVPFL